MRTYTISKKAGNGFEFFMETEADTHEAAANVAVRKLYSRKGNMTIRAIRVTGEVGKSGIFQGYLEIKNGNLNSYGDNFHVK